MDQRLLINGSLKVRTFPQNLRLLALLSENAGRIVSYERIGAIIWPRATPANRRHSIATTRYRLEVDAGQIGVNLGIKAVYREGLLMERPVEVQCAVVIPTDVIADLRQLLRSCQNQTLARSVVDRLGIGAHG